jgi:peptidoglycan hydrolase-like protein with peptidoglycan-binding domain
MSTNAAHPKFRFASTALAIAALALCLTPLVSAAKSSDDVKKVQQSLADKGYDPGQVDGVMGPQTRHAIGQYQKSQALPVTQHLDDKTAGQLGVGPESVGGKFNSAGANVGDGGKQFGHEIKKGQAVKAGKDLGVGIGRGGKDVGEGVKKAVTP